MARSRSYAERVNVLKKVLMNGNWKFVPVLEKSGKIVRDHVVIAGHDKHHPEGNYYGAADLGAASTGSLFDTGIR